MDEPCVNQERDGEERKKHIFHGEKPRVLSSSDTRNALAAAIAETSRVRAGPEAGGLDTNAQLVA